MKAILLTLFLVISLASFSQEDVETFRRDYNWISVFAEDEWSPVEELKCTFVFNINDNGDVKFYNANKGTTITYRAIGGVETGVTDNGEGYQIIFVLDDDGDECLLQLFDSQELGLKIILGPTFMIHFF